jgi:hypothetical protein
MKKPNKHICLGLIFNSIFLFSNEFNIFPEFIKGLCVGLGISLIFIGVYSEKHDLSQLKNYKKSLFNRFLTK